MEIFIKFIEHLCYVGLCIIFVWTFKKMFINFVFNNTYRNLVFKNIEEEIKSGKPDIFITNIRDVRSTLLGHNDVARIGWIEKDSNAIAIRVENSHKTGQEKIDLSTIIYLKIEEIPLLFSLTLIYLMLWYKITPNAIRNGELKIKANKQMIDKMREILQLNNICQHNSTGIKK